MERQENWKNVEGYEGLYDISDKGRVFSYYSNKILSPGKNPHGYLIVILYKNGKITGKAIHKLVADTFLSNPEGYPEVHHKNEIKTDNRLENLQFVSCQYNVEFSYAGSYVLYDPDDNIVEIFNLMKFARENNLSQVGLHNVAIGKQKSYAGYTREPGTKLNRKGEFSLISPEGEVVTFENQYEAGNFIGTYQRDICNLLKGKQKSCKGWTLEPGIELQRKGLFSLISPEGEVVTFQKQTEAANHIKTTQGNINNLLKGRHKSCKGWRPHPLDAIFAFT